MSRKGKPNWLQEWQKEHGSGNKKIQDKDHDEIYHLYFIDHLPIADISKKFNVSQRCIQKIMDKHGWKRRSRKEAFLVSNTHGKQLQVWRQENDTWCKGLTKDDPRMASLIEKGRQTQIRNGTSKGENNPMYGKVANCRAGYRTDLGHYVRSSWEANFARILNHLKIGYQYESQTFLLEDGRTYTPDFYIPSKNKFYEIKGWESSNKHMLFITQFPDIKLKVLREKDYARVLKWFGEDILIDDNKTRYTKDQLYGLFITFLKDYDERPNVSKFCKILGISNKTIIKLYGSTNQLKSLAMPEILDIERNRLVTKYREQTAILGRLPSKREFHRYYRRAATLIKLVFDGKFCQLKSFTVIST